jgi:hypothetical protein
MSSHLSGLPEIGTKAAKEEFANFILTADESLFEDFKETELEASVMSLALSKSVVTMPEFPAEQLRSLAIESGFDDGKFRRLRLVRLLLRAEFIRRAGIKETSETEEHEDEDELEASSDDGSSEDEDQEGQLTEKVAAFLANRYTYKPEIINIYYTAINKHIQIQNFHNKTIETKDRATEAWDQAKERIRSVLSMLGIEGFFIAIDVAAKRSLLLRHVLKIIGTTILPILIIAYLLVLFAKWTSNPVQRVWWWVSKEFDIKVPIEEDEGSGG